MLYKKKYIKTKIYIIALFALFMLTNTTLGEIHQISNLKPFEDTLNNANHKTLVIFDIDDVVMMPTDDYSMSRNPYRKKLWQEMKKRLTEERLELLYSIITSNAKWRLVDPKILDILSNLEKSSIPTIALTSFSTGKFGIIEKREDLRIKDLNALGVNFLNLSPFKDEMMMHQISGKYGIPMLKDGVILTAELEKDLVLNYVLSQKSYKPETIIFIDDTLKHLKSIEKLCDKLKINFHGL